MEKAIACRSNAVAGLSRIHLLAEVRHRYIDKGRGKAKKMAKTMEAARSRERTGTVGVR